MNNPRANLNLCVLRKNAECVFVGLFAWIIKAFALQFQGLIKDEKFKYFISNCCRGSSLKQVLISELKSKVQILTMGTHCYSNITNCLTVYMHFNYCGIYFLKILNFGLQCRGGFPNYLFTKTYMFKYKLRCKRS